jgi:hypothetical protein
MANDFTNKPDDVFMDVSGGSPGGEGQAGMPGEGGDPGNNGPSTGVFSPSSDCDRTLPKQGPPGNAVNPDPNRSGEPGRVGVASRRLVK